MRPYVVSTGQHREMLDQMLESFDLRPAVDLGLMRPRQGLGTLTANALVAVEEVIAEVRPDVVLVQGDTTTAMTAALAAFYAGVPVGHIEAGLRTGHARSPFPEEINRRLVSEIASWHFCPTQTSAYNLVRENISSDVVEVTGNTVVDALHWTLDRIRAEDHQPAGVPPKRAARRIVVTLHRRETQGEAQREICAALAGIARTHEDVEIVFPVHLSPAVRASVMAELSDVERVHLVEPVGYRDFVSLLATADLIVTDSGGVQEEAPSLDVPVLVMRDTTERPEGVMAGCAILCGTDPEALRLDVDRLLRDPAEYEAMASVPSPYGDGRAAERIVARLAADLGVRRPAFARASAASRRAAEELGLAAEAAGVGDPAGAVAEAVEGIEAA